jgi:hypothetical protein
MNAALLFACKRRSIVSHLMAVHAVIPPHTWADPTYIQTNVKLIYNADRTAQPYVGSQTLRLKAKSGSKGRVIIAALDATPDYLLDDQTHHRFINHFSPTLTGNAA